MMRWFGSTAARLSFAIVALLLGWLTPVHAVGPSPTATDDAAVMMMPEITPPAVFQVYLIAYRAHGPPSGALLIGVEHTLTRSAEAELDAYGMLIGRTGTTDCRYMYSGYEWMEGMGQYYLRARTYNPESGRFWTMDKWRGKQTDPSSQHKYTYGHNHPIGTVDPSGRMGIGEFLLTTAVERSLSLSAGGGFLIVATRLYFNMRPYLDSMTAPISSNDLFYVGLCLQELKRRAPNGSRAHKALGSLIGYLYDGSEGGLANQDQVRDPSDAMLRVRETNVPTVGGGHYSGLLQISHVLYVHGGAIDRQGADRYLVIALILFAEFQHDSYNPNGRQVDHQIEGGVDVTERDFDEVRNLLHDAESTTLIESLGHGDRM